MKNLFFLTLGSLLFVTCTKNEILPLGADTITCDKSTEAIVKVTYISEDYVEFFYYLELQFTNYQENVYPTVLEEKYKVEGKRIKVDYKKSSALHNYVNCGNVGPDSNNPIQETMPLASICNATAVL